MSHENVEIVERIEELGPMSPDIEAYLEFFDPGVELILVRNSLEGGSYRGLDGLRQALADVLETWETISYQREDVRAIDDLVVSLGRGVFVGKGSTDNTPIECAEWALLGAGGELPSHRGTRGSAS